MVVGLVGFFLALVVIVALVAVAGAVILAVRSKQDYDAGNVSVPGRSGAVPESWGGSHAPEALLHRRLVAAMEALRANQSFDDDGGLLDLRVELEQQAIALDERLVAAAALPEALRAEPMAQAADATDRIEHAVAELAGRIAADAIPALQAALDEIRERTALVGEARNDLDAQDAAPAAPAAPPQTSPPQSAPPQTSPSQTSPPQTSPPS
ncbi:MAG: hypothetical protein JWM89_2059 [Acidimicrobiales bacterium]|nr:hypothetical protein [Acidimicrobiales bacterium]